MCGIAGFIGGGTEFDLRAMTAALVHRGPDADGFHVDPQRRVYLGHRRLAILDAEGGAQPMWDADGSVGTVYNGEIYNHRDLRRELIALGHRFRSDHSDTEVLIHGYKAWGSDLLPRLNGMFAFALYDRRQGRLLLARDRFGEKPLFWRRTSSGISFASELPALLRHSEAPQVELDATGLRKFFAYGLFPGEWTPYRDVRKLPAGDFLVFDLATGALARSSYWRFRIEPFAQRVTPRLEAAWTDELRHLLGRAVARRLEADVPLGVFLSGGLDSSAVLAFAARHVPVDRLRTFTVGFAERSFDESRWAARVANAIGSRHAEETCRLEAAKAMVPSLLAGIGEPVADGSILPTYLLCRFARRHVTVALSGDGGDELFAGYDPFKALAVARAYRRVMPERLHPLVRRAAALLPGSHANLSLDFMVRRGLRGVGFPAPLWNPIWMAPLGPEEIAELFRRPADPEEVYAEAVELWQSCASAHPVDRTLEFYTRFYLQDGILTKTDRASMQVSLESRAPFLDNDLVDFVRRLPHSVKFRNGRTKHLLRRALKGLVPDSVVGRGKKGFGIPLSRWVTDFERPPLDDTLPLDVAWLGRAWQAHRDGREDQRHGLWAWLSLHHALRGARHRVAVSSGTAVAV